MLAPSHVVFGQFAYLAASLIAVQSPQAAEVVTAAAAALLPDLDMRDGLSGAGPVEYGVGHWPWA